MLQYHKTILIFLESQRDEVLNNSSGVQLFDHDKSDANCYEEMPRETNTTAAIDLDNEQSMSITYIFHCH